MRAPPRILGFSVLLMCASALGLGAQRCEPISLRSRPLPLLTSSRLLIADSAHVRVGHLGTGALRVKWHDPTADALARSQAQKRTTRTYLELLLGLAVGFYIADAHRSPVATGPTQRFQWSL